MNDMSKIVPVTGSAWASALAGWAALAVAIGIGRFAFTPILPMMQEDFGLSVSEAGWLASANYTGYLVGALSAIGLRLQSTIAIRAGLLVIGLSTLAMGLQHPFMLSVVLLATTGIASAWVLVFVSTWALERLALLGRSKLSGTIYAGVGTGIVIAGGACLVLMGLHARSADAWLSLGVISIAVTAATWPLLKAGPSRDPVPAPAASGIRSAEYRRLVLLLRRLWLRLRHSRHVPSPRWRRRSSRIRNSSVGPGPCSASRRSFRRSSRRSWSGSCLHRAVWIGGHLVMALGMVIPLVVGGFSGIMMAALLVGGTFNGHHHGGHAGSAKGCGAPCACAHGGNDFGVCARPNHRPGDREYSGSVNRGFAPALILAASMLALSAMSLQRKETQRG